VLRTVEAVQGLLERTVAEVLLLSNTEGRARTVGALAALLLKAVETSELETIRRELDAVKSQIAQEREPWRTTH
jgi:hypothetical protein